MRLKATRTIKALSLLLLSAILGQFGDVDRILALQNSVNVTELPQDFQIRARVDLVVVPVSVKNSDDELVAGLSQDDFIVHEDGKRQTIASFSIDPVPISAAVLVDTGLSITSYDKVRESFPALAEAFSDFDEVTVYRFDKFVTQVLDFTGDKILVETTLRTLQDPAPTQNTTIASIPFSANGPIINGIAVNPADPQPGARVSPAGTKLLHDAIFTAADALSTRQKDRRRIILVVSDGQAHGDEHSFDDAVNRLLERGIQLYAVGMDNAFLSRRFSVLDNYARQTGGDACFLNSLHAVEECYARSTEDARNQYVLAYVSTNEVRGPLPVFREIRVEVVRPGMETRYRKGYFQFP